MKELYSIERLPGEHAPRFSIRLEPSHPIFLGHFPGMPVVPGVALIGMVKAAMEITAGHSLRLSTASSIKFLDLVIPERDTELVLELNSSGHEKVSAVIYSGKKTCFRFEGSFIREQA